MRCSAIAALLLAASAHLALADTVSLTTGDKLTGTLVELNPTSVIVQTPYAGRVTIDRGAVRTLQSEKPVAITAASGERQERYLSPNPGDKGWQETVAFVPPPPPTSTPPRYTHYLDLGPD